uniref:Uncharacterized protein n=1 Tax=Aegilops tauschii subsp. strangulata TaxID=200361 RepID=A0A453A776_AEGTS
PRQRVWGWWRRTGQRNPAPPLARVGRYLHFVPTGSLALQISPARRQARNSQGPDPDKPVRQGGPGVAPQDRHWDRCQPPDLFGRGGLGSGEKNPLYELRKDGSAVQVRTMGSSLDCPTGSYNCLLFRCSSVCLVGFVATCVYILSKTHED